MFNNWHSTPSGLRRKTVLSELVVNPRVSSFMNYVELVHNYLSLSRNRVVASRSRLRRLPGIWTHIPHPASFHSMVLSFLFPKLLVMSC